MKNLKIISIISCITILLVSVVFTITKPTKILTKQPREVVFWSLQMGTFGDYLNPLINEFEKENPDLKIKWIDVPYAEGEKRTLASILSNNPPDLVNLTPDFSSILAQKQALTFIDCNDLKDYNPQIIEMLKTKDKCYAVPFYATSSITLYNKKILNEAKVVIPKTYNDMFSQSKTIYNTTNKFVTMPTLTENDTFLKILNKNNINTADLLTTTQSIEIFKEFKKLYENDLIPKESITQNHQEALEKYMSGQIAYIQTGANFLNIIKENAPQIYKITDVSTQLVGTNKKYDVSVMNLIIPKRAKNPDGALKFALFLTNNKNQLELSKLTTVLPVNDMTLKDDYFTVIKNDNIIEKARYISAKQLNNLITPIEFNNNKKEIINSLNITVQQVILNKTTIEKGLSDLSKNWKALEYK